MLLKLFKQIPTQATFSTISGQRTYTKLDKDCGISWDTHAYCDFTEDEYVFELTPKEGWDLFVGLFA